MVVKQYQLPREHEEITETIGELEKVGIIRATTVPVSPPCGQEGTQMAHGE